jgi:hypothetical protein
MRSLVSSMENAAVTMCLPNAATEAILEQSISTRQQSRIVYLEKTIEKIQLDHGNSLCSLHKEIERLSNLLSGIIY